MITSVLINNHDLPAELIPKHLFIAKDILSRIDNGEIKYGDRIPSEWEMSRKYSVSRGTVRLALDRLTYNGKIIRIPGKGTFVARPKIEHELSQLMSFSEKIKAKGLSIRTKLVRKRVIQAKGFLREKLKLQKDEKIIEIKRLRFVEDEPLVLQICFLPYNRCRAVLDENLETESLKRLLNQKCGIKLYRSEVTIEPIDPSSEDKMLMDGDNNSMYILVEGLTYDQNDHPIRFSQGIYRGDRVRLKLTTTESFDIQYKNEQKEERR